MAARLQVGAIERSNMTIQEHTRCNANCLPYKKFPMEMASKCITHSIKRLIQILIINGISRDQSPPILITVAPCQDCNQAYQLSYVDYILAHTVRKNQTTSIGDQLKP